MGRIRPELMLDAVPDVGRDQRRVLAWIDLRVMPDATSIHGVGRDIVNVSVAEGRAAFHSARDERSDGRPEAKRINRFERLSNRLPGLVGSLIGVGEVELTGPDAGTHHCRWKPGTFLVCP